MELSPDVILLGTYVLGTSSGAGPTHGPASKSSAHVRLTASQKTENRLGVNAGDTPGSGLVVGAS